MAKPVFYCDWNVVSYLKDPNALTLVHKVHAVCLIHIFSMLDPESFIIPYSIAHLADIRKGPRENHSNWINYLENLTRKWKVGEVESDRNTIGFFQIDSVSADYKAYWEEMISSEAQQLHIQKALSPFLNEQKEKALKSLEAASKGANSALFSWVAELINKENGITGIDILRVNKRFRQSLRDAEGNKIKYPEAKHLLNEENREVFLRKLNEVIKKSSMSFKSYEELDASIPNIGTFGFLSPFTEEVNRLSTVALYLGIGSERAKKDNAFQGVINDLMHLSYGLRCHYFITEDSALYERAIFVKKMKNLPVLILKMNSLNEELLKQIAAYYEKNKESGTPPSNSTNFRFIDENGNEIWTYDVKHESENDHT